MKKALILINIILGISFLFSAYTKIIAPGFFELTMISQGINLDRIYISYISRILIAFEIILGLAFLLNLSVKKITAPATILLLTIFTIHLAYLVISGNDENCGCFGEMIKMTPLESIFKNIILLILTIFAFMKSKRTTIKSISFSIVVIASLILTFSFAPIQQTDDFKFKKFTQFEGAGVVDLAEGEKLLAVFNTNCDHCQETATKLGQYDNHNIPPIYALFYNEIEEIGPKEFSEKTNTNYPYIVVGDDDFWTLLKNSPPIIYHLKDGEVIQYFEGEEIAERINANFQ